MNGDGFIVFFDYVFDCERDNGFFVFFEGDILIMDNCGFYYGRIIESVFRVMFVMRGVILLF